jgi:DMSO/TMAO reductase YedYZ molybdopterin-dependent catalytic subunit
MTTMTRREILKTGLTAAGMAAMGLPLATMPALAQGETLVPFTDIPDNMTFDSGPASASRFLDIRTIDGQLTPRDKFFATQHLGQPEVDAAAYKLTVTGLVNKPIELTLDELKKRPSIQLPAGFECSGNSPRRIEGMASNGMWTGTKLKRPAQCRRRQTRGQRDRVLRYRSRRRKRPVPRPNLQSRSALWPQHDGGQHYETRSDCRLGDER